MNPTNLGSAKEIMRVTKLALSKCTNSIVVACPPFVYISSLVAKKDEKVAIGAQDTHHEDSGSYTGEVSPLALKNMGVKYVIVGHSERRSMGEIDEMVAKKALAVIRNDMTAVVCVGESVHDEAGAFFETIKNQIKNSLAGVEKKMLKNIIVAYEPIWAIGAKEAMNPEIVQQMAIFVKKTLSDMYGEDKISNIPVLYGGSVNSKNVASIIRDGKVDGVLVGRESVNVDTLVEFIREADSA